LFVVSSKSGGTIEMQSLFKYFHARLETLKGENAGENFIAITDPETSLEKLAHQKHFRTLFITPPDVGGRYSALTYFGLVPAALMGVSAPELLERASQMARACAATLPAAENTGLKLGAALGVLAKAGRDKVTFVMSPKFASFGTWVEQLIAESTGKEGKGLIPVDGEELASPAAYGDDRVFVSLSMERSRDAGLEKKLAALEKAGHPVVRIPLTDAYDLGREFLRWEIASAVAGILLGINPFDEPNVTESKQNTGRLLEAFKSAGKLAEDPPLWERDGIRLWADPSSAAAVGRSGPAAAGTVGELLAAHVRQAVAGDYVSVMAYLTPDGAHHALLQRLRHRLFALTRAATTLGYGPRFLHSTGQLHKGGPNKGVFVQIVARDAENPAVPGESYGFSVLKNAQASGDFEALKNHACRVLRLQLSSSTVKDLQGLVRSLEKVKAG
ncbi:MAG TPA: transaldolase, partial [Elusimicrobiota bacterium]|nr:transaldolase [Elusimicrobiota bacterium]